MQRPELPDLSSESLDVKSLYPDPERFKSDEEKQAEKREIVRDNVSASSDVVGITHTDADGYGCEVMFREAFSSKEVSVVTASESGALTVDVVGDMVADIVPDDTPVYIMDLSPNDNPEDFLKPFSGFSQVTVLDHHKWTEEAKNTLSEYANLIIDTERCATQIVYDELVENKTDKLDEFAALTADHDLWIKEQAERSDALSDLAHHARREKYVRLARKHGESLIDTTEGQNLISEAQERRSKMTDIALRRAEFHEIGDYVVATTYGRCSASDVGEELYSGRADLAVMIFPTGTVSLRSAQETPIARDLAVGLGGGGHPCAAGASPGWVGDEIRYTEHWATMGQEARNRLVKVLESFFQ